MDEVATSRYAEWSQACFAREFGETTAASAPVSGQCGSGCVVEYRTCNRAVAGSNLGWGYFAPRSTQPSISIPSGSK